MPRRFHPSSIAPTTKARSDPSFEGCASIDRPRRRRDHRSAVSREFGMKRVILAVAIAATCATPALAAGTERTVAGEAQVIDGDSLVVSGVRIRILDVDAPESGQFCFAKAEPLDQGAWHCGRQAARALTEEIGDQKVSCDMTGQGIRKSWLARCAVGGRDLAEWLAANGWAVPARRTANAKSSGRRRITPRRPVSASGPAPSPCRGIGASRASCSAGDREIARPQSGRSRGRRCCTALPAAAPAGASHRAR